MKKFFKLIALALTVCLVSVAFVACVTPEPEPDPTPEPSKYFEVETVFYLDLNQSPAAATYLLNNTKFTFRTDGTCTSVFGIVGMGDQTFDRKYEIDGTKLTEINDEVTPAEEVIYNITTVSGKKVLTREDGAMTFVESSEPIAYTPPTQEIVAFDSAKTFILDPSADNYMIIALMLGADANITFAADGTCVSSISVEGTLIPVSGTYELNADGDELFMLTMAGESTYEIEVLESGLLKITTEFDVEGTAVTVTYIEFVEYFKIPMAFVIDPTLTNPAILAGVGATANMTFETDGACVSTVIVGGFPVPNARTYSISDDTLTMLNPEDDEDIAIYAITYDEDGRMTITTQMYGMDVVYVEAETFITEKTFAIDAAASNPLLVASVGDTANIAFDTDGTCVSTIIYMGFPVPNDRTYSLLGDKLTMLNPTDVADVAEYTITVNNDGKLVITAQILGMDVVYVEQTPTA